MSSCSFFGMMRFGEVSVASQYAFNPLKHLTRAHAFFGHDLRGNPYTSLDLPSAKTARAGESQSVFLNEQGNLCPLSALRNLAPALASDPLFSWRDNKGDIPPMAKMRALKRINSILMSWGWGTTFGHSFGIGGVLLPRKEDQFRNSFESLAAGSPYRTDILSAYGQRSFALTVASTCCWARQL
ncbi:hypothetical protein P692DRAFT_20881625 [Suillus brevipes Sb2]|nr:hypothetical protein P692DRAFT_20881625 [Suillus brevipes Sb2]